MLAATQRLTQLAAADGTAARWSPEQGDWLGSAAPAAQARYLQALMEAVRSRQQAGAQETDAPPPLPSGPGWQTGHPHEEMNWQRTWRLLEDESFAPEPTGR
jgi:hypothetical protein